MINLLPEEEKRKLAIIAQNKTLIFYGIILISIILIGTGLIWFVNLKMKGNLVKIEGQITSLQVESSRYKKLEDQAILIADRINEIEKLKTTPTFSEILTEFANQTPLGVKITNFSANPETKPAFRISGEAKDRSSIVQFKESLESSSFFSQVNLESISISSEGKVGFNLTATLEGK